MVEVPRSSTLFANILHVGPLNLRVPRLLSHWQMSGQTAQSYAQTNSDLQSTSWRARASHGELCRRHQHVACAEQKL